jgi:hypothetical protein
MAEAFAAGMRPAVVVLLKMMDELANPTSHMPSFTTLMCLVICVL